MVDGGTSSVTKMKRLKNWHFAIINCNVSEVTVAMVENNNVYDIVVIVASKNSSSQSPAVVKNVPILKRSNQSSQIDVPL